MLAERGQCLAFEPPDLTALLDVKSVMSGEGDLFARARAGESAGQQSAKTPPSKAPLSTLGGMVATGLSGPRRPKAGAVRDHVLGIAGASGRGEFFMAGGKVVKNVTGLRPAETAHRLLRHARCAH